MGYVEERIKYLAAKAWQNQKNVHEMTCGERGCGSWSSTNGILITVVIMTIE